MANSKQKRYKLVEDQALGHILNFVHPYGKSRINATPPLIHFERMLIKSDAYLSTTNVWGDICSRKASTAFIIAEHL